MPNQITDHGDRAVSRISSQFTGKPNIEALVRSLTVAVQSWEDVAWDVLVERTIETAIGVQLDTIGKIVGQDRAGLTDADYRSVIRARITANRSSGLAETIIKVAKLVINDGAESLILTPHYPGAAILEINGITIDADLANLIISLLLDTASAGVRLCIVYGATDLADAFTFDTDTIFNLDTEKGLGDVFGDPTSGGAFWEIRCSVGDGNPVLPTAPSELWELPASPSAFDIEFNEGNQLTNGWVGFGDLDFDQAPSYTPGFSDNDLVKISIDSMRRSTMVWQPSIVMPSTIPRVPHSAGGIDHGGIYLRPFPGIALPDGFYWCRAGMLFDRNGSASGSNDDGNGVLSLLAWDSSNAVPDHRYGPHMMWQDEDEPSGDVEWEYHMHNGSANPDEVTAITSADWGNEGVALQYWGIGKVGDEFSAWAANGAGGWVRIGQFTYTESPPIECVAMELENQSENFVGFCDFIRFRPLTAIGELDIP